MESPWPNMPDCSKRKMVQLQSAFLQIILLAANTTPPMLSTFCSVKSPSTTFLHTPRDFTPHCCYHCFSHHHIYSSKAGGGEHFTQKYRCKMYLDLLCLPNSMFLNNNKKGRPSVTLSHKRAHSHWEA